MSLFLKIFILCLLTAIAGAEQKGKITGSKRVNEHLQQTNKKKQIQDERNRLEAEEASPQLDHVPSYVGPRINYGVDMQIQNYEPETPGPNSYENANSEVEIQRAILKSRNKGKQGSKTKREPADRLPASVPRSVK